MESLRESTQKGGAFYLRRADRLHDPGRVRVPLRKNTRNSLRVRRETQRTPGNPEAHMGKRGCALFFRLRVTLNSS